GRLRKSGGQTSWRLSDRPRLCTQVGGEATAGPSEKNPPRAHVTPSTTSTRARAAPTPAWIWRRRRVRAARRASWRSARARASLRWRSLLEATHAPPCTSAGVDHDRHLDHQSRGRRWAARSRVPTMAITAGRHPAPAATKCGTPQTRQSVRVYQGWLASEVTNRDRTPSRAPHIDVRRSPAALQGG